jgi:hypothetical protein
LLPLHQLDFNVDTGRQVELGEGIQGFLAGVQDVDEPFVAAHFELFAGFLVHVGRTKNRLLGGPRREGHRTGDFRSGAPRRLDDLADGLIQQPMVEGLELNSDLLLNRHVAAFAWSSPLLQLFEDSGTQTARKSAQPIRLQVVDREVEPATLLSRKTKRKLRSTEK